MDAEKPLKISALEDVSEYRRDQIMKGFRSTGLDHDSYNSWMPLFYVSSPESLGKLTGLPHYEDFVRESCGGRLAEQIIEMSNVEAIREYDRIVDLFNADLPRIKAEVDMDAVRRFHDEANRLIRNK